MPSKILISVVGPTAIGKTSLAIALAKQFETEIISADSRQFYKEMRIGTAVPSREELAAVRHHFIQHKSIFENYSVGDFEREAIKLIEARFQEKEFLVMAGGSGLYIDAITKGLDVFPEVDPAIRTNLNEKYRKEGISVLQQQLEKMDPVYYAKVDRENPHRLIRALEVCIGSGKAYSSFLNTAKPPRPFITISVGLNAEREVVYERINRRVDQMMAQGLLEEVRALLPHKGLNALQTVGYQELFNYLEGTISLEEAVSEIKKNTRRFAKRQLTWFRKNKETIWVTPETPIEEVVKRIKQRSTEVSHENN
ncbi:tRNA (adenosine(37)-N6)-dimethylallyltransferase MiaA [Poritiphilus flavus]|uniref:tRNA dimethylallyltransferase n=1 Tax=Poritiphilus flavus TaxID=2697053 RepID=A0A6L9EF76_9FLAO|nr:tRNA (adenosine(37)-N6)-dimethylallyltransferase MiaA [Poritiphilus flavus]NAS13395.1 tRNA (adenosine(37)-N6)-dimethylallyltransferase MiaA [Poritiphilus flavus]